MYGGIRCLRQGFDIIASVVRKWQWRFIWLAMQYIPTKDEYLPIFCYMCVTKTWHQMTSRRQKYSWPGSYVSCQATLTELGAFMRTEFLCISVWRVASGPRVKLASCKSALTPPLPPNPPPPPPVGYSTDRSKAVIPVLVLLFVALWFILRGDLFYVLPCVTLFLCFF